VDTLFIFFIELGIMLSLYYTRNRSWLLLVLIGITTGIAVLTKWLPGLIVLPVLFVLLLQEKSWTSALYRCLIVLALAIIVFMPWQVYIYSVYPQEAAWENYFNGYRHIFEPLEGHEGAIWYQILEMPRVFGELIYIPLALFFFGLYKEKFKSMHFALAIWLILPYFFFSLVATKMPGYVMISAPAVFIILSYTFWDLYQRLSEFRYKKVAIFLLALLIILPIRYTFERVRPFRDIDRNPVWAQELRTLQTKVGNTKAAVFNVEHNIEAMFYAKVSAYPFIPNLQQVAQAQSRGFRIFIYDSPDIPFDISNNKDIVILHTMK
jgi:4-amino-4-deoxy-L-arabinose transferase